MASSSNDENDNKLTLEEACIRLRENDKSLTRIDLAQTQVGDAGAVALAFGLKKNTFLTEMHLGCASIGLNGVTRLSQALKTNRYVERLYLQGNNLGDKGAECLAEIFCGKGSSSNIKLLNLARNAIGDVGVAALAQAVIDGNNTTLTKLYIYENNFGDLGASALAEMIFQTVSLQELFVWDNKIGTEGLDDLKQAFLKVNSSSSETSRKKLLLRTHWKVDGGAKSVVKSPPRRPVVPVSQDNSLSSSSYHQDSRRMMNGSGHGMSAAQRSTSTDLADSDHAAYDRTKPPLGVGKLPRQWKRPENATGNQGPESLRPPKPSVKNLSRSLQSSVDERMTRLDVPSPRPVRSLVKNLSHRSLGAESKSSEGPSDLAGCVPTRGLVKKFSNRQLGGKESEGKELDVQAPRPNRGLVKKLSNRFLAPNSPEQRVQGDGRRMPPSPSRSLVRSPSNKAHVAESKEESLRYKPSQNQNSSSLISGGGRGNFGGATFGKSPSFRALEVEKSAGANSKPSEQEQDRKEYFNALRAKAAIMSGSNHGKESASVSTVRSKTDSQVDSLRTRMQAPRNASETGELVAMTPRKSKSSDQFNALRAKAAAMASPKPEPSHLASPRRRATMRAAMSSSDHAEDDPVPMTTLKSSQSEGRFQEGRFEALRAKALGLPASTYGNSSSDQAAPRNSKLVTPTNTKNSTGIAALRSAVPSGMLAVPMTPTTHDESEPDLSESTNAEGNCQMSMTRISVKQIEGLQLNTLSGTRLQGHGAAASYMTSTKDNTSGTQSTSDKPRVGNQFGALRARALETRPKEDERSVPQTPKKPQKANEHFEALRAMAASISSSGSRVEKNDKQPQVSSQNRKSAVQPGKSVASASTVIEAHTTLGNSQASKTARGTEPEKPASKQSHPYDGADALAGVVGQKRPPAGLASERFDVLRALALKGTSSEARVETSWSHKAARAVATSGQFDALRTKASHGPNMEEKRKESSSGTQPAISTTVAENSKTSLVAADATTDENSFTEASVSDEEVTEVSASDEEVTAASPSEEEVTEASASEEEVTEAASEEDVEEVVVADSDSDEEFVEESESESDTDSNSGKLVIEAGTTSEPIIEASARTSRTCDRSYTEVSVNTEELESSESAETINSAEWHDEEKEHASIKQDSGLSHRNKFGDKSRDRGLDPTVNKDNSHAPKPTESVLIPLAARETEAEAARESNSSVASHVYLGANQMVSDVRAKAKALAMRAERLRAQFSVETKKPPGPLRQTEKVDSPGVKAESRAEGSGKMPTEAKPQDRGQVEGASNRSIGKTQVQSISGGEQRRTSSFDDFITNVKAKTRAITSRVERLKQEDIAREQDSPVKGRNYDIRAKAVALAVQADCLSRQVKNDVLEDAATAEYLDRRRSDAKAKDAAYRTAVGDAKQAQAHDQARKGLDEQQSSKPVFGYVPFADRSKQKVKPESTNEVEQFDNLQEERRQARLSSFRARLRALEEKSKGEPPVTPDEDRGVSRLPVPAQRRLIKS